MIRPNLPTRRSEFFPFIFALLLFWTGPTAGQDARALNDVTIVGRIVDTDRGAPIEYANIVLHRLSDSTMAQGTVSDPQGRFAMGNVPVGRYYLAIHFIGYEDAFVHDINIRRDGGVTDLGDIRLTLTPIEMDEVEVAADRAPVVYELDKKVINVDRQLTATSGTAVDVLQNVPSVTVDLDGTVRLRGSGSFTVLIDGRPSPLEGSEALAQIPSSAIENIEIITNPSARYNPEGMSGIINVIMKKDRRQGNSGMVNLSAGWDDKYGSEGLYTLRQDGFAVTFGADFNSRVMGTVEREESSFLGASGPTEILADGRSNRRHERWSLRGGLEYLASPKDNFTLTMRYGRYDFGENANRDYSELAAGSPLASEYLSRGSFSRGGIFAGADFEYRRTFDTKDHALVSQLSYRSRGGEEKSSDELIDGAGLLRSGRRATEEGPGGFYEAKIDYTLPLTEKGKFVAGYEGRFGAHEDDNTLAEFNPSTGAYEDLPAFGRETQYARQTQGVYSMYSEMFGPVGLQAGIRAEHTDRRIELSGETFAHDFTRWDFFPTLHSSYSISPTQQFMASYTRRIEHSRPWALEPYITWVDAYNVRSGNPDLKPEYIDSYEAGYQTHLGKHLVSTEVYHRVTSNKVEFVRSAYTEAENVTLRRAQNVGSEFSTGMELMVNLAFFDLWDVYLLGNLFDYRVEGALNGQNFTQQTFTWNTRFNNTFKLTPSTTLQVNASYNSPTVSAQGRVEGYVLTTLAVRQELFDRQLALTLDVSDVLRTGERESRFSGPDFSQYNYSFSDAPVVMLSARWFINQMQSDRGRNRPPRDSGMGEDEF